MKPTVFFGPFVGELGWEMLFWQGWVRKVSRTLYRNHHRIVSSVAGREPFYPDAHEFWPVPERFTSRRTSGHAYITDGWRNGLPGKDSAGTIAARKLLTPRPGGGLNAGRVAAGAWRLLPHPMRSVLKRAAGVGVQRRLNVDDIEQAAEDMLLDFQVRLPGDATLFVPWRVTRTPDGVTFGAEPVSTEESPSGYRIHQIGYEHQLLEPLVPTDRGRALLAEHISASTPLAAVFPRCRSVRRMDKNWPKADYLRVIDEIRRIYPDLTIALFGEPGGAHFADGAPVGCLDLINLTPQQRLDVQVAALQQSRLALGSISGALTIALATGCPTLLWGYQEFEKVYREANYMRTPMDYIGDPSPSVDAVVDRLRELPLRSAPTA